MSRISDQQSSIHASGIALPIIAFGIIVIGLIYGRPFLLPLALAIFLCNIMEAMVQGFSSVKLWDFRVPRWLATLLGLATVGLGVYLIFTVLLGQVDAINATLPRYLSRFQTIAGNLTEWLGPDRSARVRSAIAGIDVMGRLPTLIASTQSMIITVLLIIAYVAFLFVEREHVGTKIAAMFSDPRQAANVSKLLEEISHSVRRYIWFKTIVSVLTGVACYAVLRFEGVDFAETWALLIFILNYIPNIGSIIAVAFPCLLALVQFDSLKPFLVLVISLTAIQVAIGSVLEPMLMGKGLNMSPFAIILSLSFWGLIWGIVGMFLSVPILVIIMIVCAHVPSWRWIAVALSRDGSVTA
ncbi:MAG: AI-2E family transporter [Hyphomicrobium sp.]|uniref:AI-2E family transporter n=1 Tax=Hyphomicrobium sp. TaxID=82 RepID=UPI0039E4F101